MRLTYCVGRHKFSSIHLPDNRFPFLTHTKKENDHLSDCQLWFLISQQTSLNNYRFIAINLKAHYFYMFEALSVHQGAHLQYCIKQLHNTTLSLAYVDLLVVVVCYTVDRSSCWWYVFLDSTMNKSISPTHWPIYCVTNHYHQHLYICKWLRIVM